MTQTDMTIHDDNALNHGISSGVRIHILDEEGNESMVFPATKIGSITEDAEKA